MARLIEREGRLAIDFGWIRAWENPEDTRLIYVAPASVNVAHYRHLLDLEVVFEGDVGRVLGTGADRPVLVRPDGWEQVIERRPVRKPRRRAGYDLFWEYGRWHERWRGVNHGS